MGVWDGARQQVIQTVVDFLNEQNLFTDPKFHYAV
jgi:hypothetical protein